MKKEAREYFLEHGSIEGYVEDRIIRNDQRWFIFMIILIIGFTYIYSEQYDRKTKTPLPINGER